MRSSRATAAVTGIFFVVAAAASIPALALYQPALTDPAYALGAGADGQVLLGGFLELLTAAAIVGTAVTLYPVIRRQNAGLALGYVAGRLFEATVIALGMIATVALVTLRQDGPAAGADDGGIVAVSQGLVAVHDWTFLVGPGLAIGVNTTVLAWLVRRAALVPRWISTVGLVGGPLVFASSTAIMFGVYDQVSTLGALGAVPVFAWEMSLAVYLIARGFRPSPVSTAPLPVGAVA